MKEPWKKHELYRKTVENLPVVFVEQFIGNKLRKTKTEMNLLEEDIRTNGFQHPLTLIVGKMDHQVRLGEGNHRLAIAKKLGLQTVPVYTVLWNYSSGYQSVTYPYLHPEIMSMERKGYLASQIFTKQIVLKGE